MLKGAIKNTLAQVAGKVITVLISLLTTGILTRKLGVGVYGSFTLVTSVFILLDSLADFGTKIIGVKEMSNQDEQEQKETFRQLISLRLILATIAFGVGLIFILFFNGFRDIRLESLIALTMIWFTSMAGSLEIVFQTKLRMDLKVIGDIIFPLIFVLTLVFWPSTITLLWVFSMYLVARIMSLLVISKLKIFNFQFSILNLKNIRFKTLCHFVTSPLTGRLLKESWPMGVYLIVFTGYDRAVDSLMIQHYIGVKEVAFYGLAYKIYSNLIQPSYFFVNSIFPTLASKNNGKKKLFVGSTLLLVSGILTAIPIVYILAPWIVSVLAGSGFEAAVTVLRILLIALFFSYIGHLVGFTLISRGGQKQMLQLGLISLLVNVGLNLWAIPRYGIVGAAVVTGITEATACGLMCWQLWKSAKQI